MREIKAIRNCFQGPVGIGFLFFVFLESDSIDTSSGRTTPDRDVERSVPTDAYIGRGKSVRALSLQEKLVLILSAGFSGFRNGYDPSKSPVENENGILICLWKLAMTIASHPGG